MKKLLLMSAVLLLSSALVVHHQPAAQNQYVPKVELCADGSKVLCPKLPAYIVKDAGASQFHPEQSGRRL